MQVFVYEVVLYMVAQQSWGQGQTFQFSSGYSISFVALNPRFFDKLTIISLHTSRTATGEECLKHTTINLFCCYAFSCPK